MGCADLFVFFEIVATGKGTLRGVCARGAAVVPEVSFNNTGGVPSHSVVASVVLSREILDAAPLETAVTTAFALQTASAASRCRSLTDCSSGRTISRLRRQEIKIDGQS